MYDFLQLADLTPTWRGNDFVSEVRRTSAEMEIALELCRCNEQRSGGCSETNYGRVIWINRM